MDETSKTTVLVVDDSPEILLALEDLLRAEGHAVVVAHDGRQGLDKLLAGGAEVALVDLHLPDLSGIELIERARAAKVDTQLVLMTAHADVASAASAVRHRAFAYLFKPFDVDLVLRTVANAAQLFRLERENRRMLVDLRAREEALGRAAEEAEARAAELDAVDAVTSAASASLDRREMLAKALSAAARVLEADVEVLLADETRGVLELAAREGGRVPAGEGERVTFGAGLAGFVARSGGPLFADALEQEAFVRPALGGAFRAYAAVPLVAKGRLVGVMGAGRPAPFDARGKALFTRLAGVVAVALENALLFERAQRAVQELRQSQARLLENERLAVVGQLTGGLAHEVNTPTAFILANLHVLGAHLATLERFVRSARASSATGAPDDAVNRALSEAGHIVEECREGGERIRRIVRDLRAFGRSAREGLQPVNLAELVDSTLGMLRPLLETKARVEREIAEVPVVEGQPGRLTEVLVHLLRNALDALPDGAPGEQRIVVSTRVEGESVIVRVEDSGTGIPAHVLPRVFDPYFTTKPVGRGTGLGLAFSLDVVRHHGGELLLQSVEGQGTRAEVRLPVSPRARRAGSPD